MTPPLDEPPSARPLPATPTVTSLAQLTLHSQLGKGAYGAVYYATLKAAPHTPLAAKVIDLELEHDIHSVNNEIAILSSCALPQITAYHGSFVRGSKLWIVMEFVDGGSLFDLVKAIKHNTVGRYAEQTILTEARIAVILREILLALEYLHSQGQIHRDLKSQNILMSTLGAVKLTDFGVSAQLASNFSRRNTTVGTPYWMAPEVIVNDFGGHSFKADIWSVGALAYELITSLPPLQALYAPMVALHKIPKLNRVANKVSFSMEFVDTIKLRELGVSDAFKDFMLKCFIVDPASRPSASKILKHRFLVKHAPLGTHSCTAIFTALGEFDPPAQPHAPPVYVPTLQGDDTVELMQFDISAIMEAEPASSLRRPSMGSGSSTLSKPFILPSDPGYKARQSSTTLTPPSSSGESTLHTKQKDPSQKEFTLKDIKTALPPLPAALRDDMSKALHRSFTKVDRSVALSTRQYDALVRFNAALLDVFSILEVEEKGSTPLGATYIKTLLREIAKQEPLCDAVIPSAVAAAMGPVETVDDIELELWNSWCEKMVHL